MCESGRASRVYAATDVTERAGGCPGHAEARRRIGGDDFDSQLTTKHSLIMLATDSRVFVAGKRGPGARRVEDA